MLHHLHILCSDRPGTTLSPRRQLFAKDAKKELQRLQAPLGQKKKSRTIHGQIAKIPIELAKMDEAIKAKGQRWLKHPESQYWLTCSKPRLNKEWVRETMGPGTPLIDKFLYGRDKDLGKVLNCSCLGSFPVKGEENFEIEEVNWVFLTERGLVYLDTSCNNNWKSMEPFRVWLVSFLSKERINFQY